MKFIFEFVYSFGPDRTRKICLAIKSLTRATESRDKIAGVTSVLVSETRWLNFVSADRRMPMSRLGQRQSPCRWKNSSKAQVDRWKRSLRSSPAHMEWVSGCSSWFVCFCRTSAASRTALADLGFFRVGDFGNPSEWSERALRESGLTGEWN